MKKHNESVGVSVIIPSYNCEAYIRQTINSILDQTYRNIEILVIDDGSTDGTPDIVEKFGDKVRLIRQKNAGVCAARNLGFRESRGKFVCFMDHDDYWFPEKISSQVFQMQENPVAGVVFNNFKLWHARNGAFPDPSDLTSHIDPRKKENALCGWVYHAFLMDCQMLTSTAMFRREVLDINGVFDESLPYGEDWDLWLRIAQNTQFIKLSRSMTLYRQHVKQGNRLVRPVDYRTLILERAVKKWGYASRDGRRIPQDVFEKRLAAYHADFGLHHLREGHFRMATRSLMKAWGLRPAKIKYPAYLAAGVLGWKPAW